MHDLHVDGELLAVVVEDQDADGATARLKGVRKAAREVGLVNDGEAVLDVASLGHGNDQTVLEIEDAVLLEDGAEHGLDNDAGGRVADKGGLLVQLLGEQVNTEVAVLAGGGRGRDADDLARAALQHQEVTEADVVAGDGDGVGQVGLAAVTGAGTTSRLVNVDIHVVVVLMATGVDNAVRELVDALAEGVVVTVLVVVTHLGFLVGGGVAGRLNSLVRDKLGVDLGGGAGNTGVNGEVVDVGGGAGLVGGATWTVDSYVELGTGVAFAVLTFSDVNRAGEGLGGSGCSGVNLDVSVGVVGARGGRTALFVGKVLVLGTGTVVLLLLTIVDLFVAETVLLLRLLLREVDVGSERRRVLTFPSGFGFGKLDFDLLVSLDGSGLGLGVLVGRGEDAEGDGDAGFKVQIDGGGRRKRIGFSFNLS